MKSTLTKGMNEQDKSEFRQSFVAAKSVRDRLTEVLNESIDSLHQAQLNDDDYDSPSWATKQADRLGQIKAHKKLLNLLQ